MQFAALFILLMMGLFSYCDGALSYDLHFEIALMISMATLGRGFTWDTCVA